jgi:CRP/FNR family cyclic AMP-dependent transcriptional regulator
MAERRATADLLAGSPLFATLTAAERLSLAEAMSDIELERGQLLFSRGDPGKHVYLVMQGRIRLSVLSAEGREISFSHAVPGDVFGEVAALDDVPRSADATAITHARLKVMSHSTLHRLLLNNPSFALSIIKLLCMRLRDLSKHYEAIGLHPVEIRLARLLFEMLQEQAAVGTNAPPTLPLDMTQNELGLLIGTTRQRANAALVALERAGAIVRSKGQLACNMRELLKIAQPD